MVSTGTAEDLFRLSWSAESSCWSMLINSSDPVNSYSGYVPRLEEAVYVLERKIWY